jgi:hypothetical protein
MKKYKKGTTVYLNCCTHDIQSRATEPYTLEVDMTSDELEELAEQFFWDTKEPEWWVSEQEEDDNL